MIWDFTATDFIRQGRGDYTSKLCICSQNTPRGLRIQNQNKNAKYAIAPTWQGSTNLGLDILWVWSKDQVVSEWWELRNDQQYVCILYIFQIQVRNFVCSWLWKISCFLIPEQIKSSFMGQPTYILQLCTYVLCCIAFGCWLSKSSYRKKLGSKFVQLVCMRENFDLLCCRRRIYFAELSASCCPNQTPKKGF